MKIYLNGRFIEIDDNITTDALRDRFKPDADIVILNGFPVETSLSLKDGDTVNLIKRSEIPSDQELECLLVSRHSPGVYEILKKSSVVVAGVGGLGSNIVVSLSRMGVGRIRFIDFDVVEPSNINRQYYFIDQIGMKKVFALHNTLLRINPYINYEPIDAKIDEKNSHQLLKGFDVVIEAFDKAEEKSKLTSFMLSNLKDIPFIAASGVAGYGDTEKIKINRIKENFFLVGDLKSGADVGMGLMATRVAVAANIQANLAVRIMLGDI
ncbi:MAG: sulfur carrier protein ThiS adenylyltransferase ThiF [Deferribacterales bacterium]